jgi:hydrogenase-1 operon protein HyaF
MSTPGGNGSLRGIPVKVQGGVATMNVRPLLHEVRHALQRLLATGEPTTIDLASIPMTPAELDDLDAKLGVGEVRVTLEVLGPSEFHETRYPGVWRLTHFNAERQVVGRYIEIARVPAMLLSQQRDMEIGLDALVQTLEAG